MVNIEGEDARSRRPGGVARDENCRYTTVRKYHCSTHRDADADAPVQKCEKTVQVLKHCVGRPAEVVESKTEYVEGDVPEEILRGSRMDSGAGGGGVLAVGGFDWPGAARSVEDAGRDVVSRALFAGFEELVQAAEEMAQGFVGRLESTYDEDRRGGSGGGEGRVRDRVPGFWGRDGGGFGGWRQGAPDDAGSASGGGSGGGAGGRAAAAAPNWSDFSSGSQEV